MARFNPLSRRSKGLPPDDALYEGTPDWLTLPLRKWLSSALRNEELLQTLGVRLHINGGDVGRQLLSRSGDELLEAVDAVLFYWSESRVPLGSFMMVNDQYQMHAERLALRELLNEGGSAWRLSNDMTGLERRVDETVTEAVRTAADAEGVAGVRLRNAWRDCYGSHPDPAKSYSESVKAVEAAAIPVVEPNNSSATLNSVRGMLRSTRDGWCIGITDRRGDDAVDVVTSMLDLLIRGQTERHEGVTPARPISQESAEMAVHLAATLVQWFTAGHVRRS